MHPLKIAALSLLGIMLLVSAYMAYARLGLLPWFGILLCALGLFVTRNQTGRRALFSATSLFIVIAASWTGTLFYVYSNWESGEVVDISLDDATRFRTWVVSDGKQEIVIYECPPEHQASLTNSTKAALTKGGGSYQVNVNAVPVALDSEALGQVYGLYESKYAAQSRATDVYYLLVGPKRGSQLYLLYLTETS